MNIRQLEHDNEILNNRIANNNKQLFKLRHASTASKKAAQQRDVFRNLNKVSHRSIYTILEAPSNIDGEYYITKNKKVVRIQHVSLESQAEEVYSIISRALVVPHENGVMTFKISLLGEEKKSIIKEFCHGGIEFNENKTVARAKISLLYSPSYNIAGSLLGGILAYGGAEYEYTYYLGSRRKYLTKDISNFKVWERNNDK